AIDKAHAAQPLEIDDATPQRDRRTHTLADQLAIDRDVRVPDEHAKRDRAVRVVERASDELAVGVDEVDRRAGLGRDRAWTERLSVSPRMAEPDARCDVAGEADRVLANDGRAADGASRRYAGLRHKVSIDRPPTPR